MITNSQLTAAQSKWLALVEYYFAEVYSSGIITYPQLTAAHNKFLELRKTDKKYKTGWPIWLITKNQIARGVYKLPVDDGEVEEISPEILGALEQEYWDEMNRELKQFNIVA